MGLARSEIPSQRPAAWRPPAANGPKRQPGEMAINKQTCPTQKARIPVKTEAAGRGGERKQQMRRPAGNN